MRRSAIALVLVVLAIAGVGVARVASSEATTPPTTTSTGGHQPVTLCHKPGTPAEQELTVDNSSVVQAHLAHGDTLGPCPGTTTTTETTETTTDETTTTTDTPPPPPRVCPDGNPPTPGEG